MRRSRSVFFGVLSVVFLCSGAILAFAAIGDFLGMWGTLGSADGQLERPFGVASAPNGDVYVADAHNQRIQYFSATGAYKGKWGTAGTGDGQFATPVDVAVAANGDVYVVERHGNRVQYFSATGVYKGQWGSFGTGAGEFGGPWGIAVAPNGDVYVADTGNDRIQYFSPAGVYKGQWGVNGSGDGELKTPYDVAVAPGGDVYVADTTNWRIQYFTPTGTYKGEWGSAGSTDGAFNNHRALAVAWNGDVYVADTFGDRIQYFSATGTYKGKWGSNGTGVGQFTQPHGIDVALSGNVYVADTLNDRIQYFEGPPPVPPLPASISVAGVDRYSTAVKASQIAFPIGAETVVIATGANWPDALGGTSLAGVVGGPILLVERENVPSAVMSEITRLKAKRAFILGGPSAVGEKVESALKTKLGTAKVTRIAGSDRYQTADRVGLRVISELGTAYDGTAFVATGGDFPDALAAAPLAARQRWPLFLADPATGLSSGTKAAMAKVDRAIILGGTAVVPKATEDVIKAMPGKTTRRLWGPDRYATAVVVANYAVDSKAHTWNRVGITTGIDFPDALAGGVLQGKMGSVMLLTAPTALNPRTANVLSANKSKITTVTFFGGTKAVSTKVRTDVGNLVK